MNYQSEPGEIVSLDHPPSIAGPYTQSSNTNVFLPLCVNINKVAREDLKNACERAFILHGVLSKEECLHYVQSTEAAGYKSLDKTFPGSYRSNDRVMIIDSKLADALFNRIISHLNAEDCNCNPMGPSGEGIWVPLTFNPGIKFNRYRSGCRFAPHRDGPWTPDVHQQSIYTLVLYLNDCQTESAPFTGGETNFLAEEEEERKDEKNDADKLAADAAGTKDELSRAISRPHRVLCSVSPRAGSALLFKHQALHEGAPLTAGTKYILRTELIFYRSSSVLEQSALSSLADNPQMKLIGELYRSSEAALKSGDSSLFVQRYLEAIRLQHSTTAPVAAPTGALGTLSRDILLHVISYLSLNDIARILRASKAFYRLARDPGFWRERFRMKYKVPWANKPDKTLAVDWYSAFKQQFMKMLDTLENPKLIVFVGATDLFCGQTDANISAQISKFEKDTMKKFSCPYCTQQCCEGDMEEHCLRSHAQENQQTDVTCPMCTSDPKAIRKVFAQFFTHLAHRHTGIVSIPSICSTNQYHQRLSVERKAVDYGPHCGNISFYHTILHERGKPPTASKRAEGYEPLWQNQPMRLSTNFGKLDVSSQWPIYFFEAFKKQTFKRIILIFPEGIYNVNAYTHFDRGVSMGLRTSTSRVSLPAMILRRYSLKSGIVVALDSDEEGSVSLVLEGTEVKTIVLNAAAIREPKKIATAVHAIVDASERACVGFTVILSGWLVAIKRQEVLSGKKWQDDVPEKTESEAPALGTVFSLRAKFSAKPQPPPPLRATEKAKEKDDEATAADLPLWSSILRSHLTRLHSSYRVLCTSDCEWDAVEGAARAPAKLKEEPRKPFLIELEPLLRRTEIRK